MKLAEAMKTLRPAVRTSEADPQRRAAIFRDLVSAEALDAIGTDGDAQHLKDWLRQRHPHLKI